MSSLAAEAATSWGAGKEHRVVSVTPMGTLSEPAIGTPNDPAGSFDEPGAKLEPPRLSPRVAPNLSDISDRMILPAEADRTMAPDKRLSGLFSPDPYLPPIGSTIDADRDKAPVWPIGLKRPGLSERQEEPKVLMQALPRTSTPLGERGLTPASDRDGPGMPVDAPLCNIAEPPLAGEPALCLCISASCLSA